MHSDFLILGAGIIGLCVARELKRRFPSAKIVMIDKEEESGVHASGRNSGVLHAGFYYTANSLKAKFTRDGNQELLEYCMSNNLSINRCGKLVVARNESDLPLIDELMRRAKNNGVDLQEISISDAKTIEPRVKSYKRILYSPNTASTNPLEVVHSLTKKAQSEGIEMFFRTEYIKRKSGNVIQTSKGLFEAGFLVNAAGLYADKVARDFFFSENYRILPFKGLYLYSNEKPGAIKTNIYPVPDIRNPFLGVHFTITGDGHIKIGPTAIPALWREQYSLLKGFNPAELLEILSLSVGLAFHSNFDFKRLAFEELMKYSRSKMVSLASELAEGVNERQFTKWGKSGIRAQLYNIQTKSLEMDFVIQGDAKSVHVLNAVSPGYTCSMPFAKHVCDSISI